MILNKKYFDNLPFTPMWKWTYFDNIHERDEIMIYQNESLYYGDTILNFGPLSTSLDNLFAMGFELYIHGNVNCKKISLKLCRNKETYVIAKAPLYEFIKDVDLCKFISTTKNYLLRKTEPLVEIKNLDYCFNKISAQYPKPNSNETVMIGNMTIEEYVKYKLKETYDE